MAISRLMIIFLALGSGFILSGVELRAGLTLRTFDLGVLLAAVFFYALVLPKGVPVRGVMPFLLISCAYMFYVGTNGMFLRSTSVGIKEAIQIFLFVNFFVMTTYCLNRPNTMRPFLMCLLLSLWIVAIYNATYHLSLGIVSGWKELDEPKLSHSIIVTILAVAALTYSGLSRGWKVMLGVALVFLLLSGERKGWLGAIFGIFMASLISSSGVLEKRTIMRALALFGSILVLLVAAVLLSDLLPEYVARQLQSSFDFARMLTEGHGLRYLLAADTTMSNRARIFGIQQAIEMYSANPVFGVGIENYKRLVNQLNVVDVFKKGAHNEVLRIAAELGTVGLVLYFGMYAAAAARVRNALPSMPYYTPDQQFRLRLGVGLMAYGFAANLFLGGGGINLFLIFLPASLIYSVPVLVSPQAAKLAHHRARLDATSSGSTPLPSPVQRSMPGK